MASYQIKIYYSTGDSFNSYDTSDVIDIVWNDIKYAKESLQRIKNHNEYYQNNSDLWSKPKGKLPKGVIWDDKYRMICLELIGKNGKPQLYSSFWTGYFDTLQSAEIIVSGKDMSYQPGY